MPVIHVTLTPGAFNVRQRNLLAYGLTQAMLNAESIPAEPLPQSRAMVLMQELPDGHFYSAGEPAAHLVRGVFAILQVSAGVLDGARKARLAIDVQAVAQAVVAGLDDSRPVITSLIINEVPEGQWCLNGSIARLPDMMAAVRHEHLCGDLSGERADGRVKPSVTPR